MLLGFVGMLGFGIAWVMATDAPYKYAFLMASGFFVLFTVFDVNRISTKHIRLLD